MNNMQGFGAQKQQAINQMNEMQKRATKSKEAVDTPQKITKKSPSKGNGLPIFANLALNDDTLIILGLILILYSEKSDTLLLLALAYILM